MFVFSPDLLKIVRETMLHFSVLFIKGKSEAPQMWEGLCMQNISAVSVGNVCGCSTLLPKNRCSWLQGLQLLLF